VKKKPAFSQFSLGSISSIGIILKQILAPLSIKYYVFPLKSDFFGGIRIALHLPLNILTLGERK
jgi:hypothetical protein